MAIKNEYTLSVDIKKSVSNITPRFVQYDTAVLYFRVFDDGKPFDLTSVTKVEVAHKKYSGKTELGEATIVLDSSGNSVIKYEYLGSEMSEEGDVLTSVSILSNENKVSIRPFKVEIVKDLREGVIENSQREFGVLQKLIADVESLIKSSQDKLVEIDGKILETTQQIDRLKESEQQFILAEQSRADAESTRVLNETQRQSNEEDRQLFELAREDNEDLRIEAENNRVLSENSRVEEENKRKTSETARIQEEGKRVNAETLRYEEENKRATAESLRITAEEERVLSESSRNSAENERNTAEQLRVSAESDRVLAESNRNTAESERVASEQARKLSEEARENAELVREKQEAKRQTDTANLITDVQNAVNSAEEKIVEIDNVVSSSAQSIADVNTLVENTGYREPFNTLTSYKKNNIVSYDGSSYIAKKDSLGITPTNTEYWGLLAQKGVDGKGSVSTVNGIAPELDGNVNVFHKDVNPPSNVNMLWIDISK